MDDEPLDDERRRSSRNRLPPSPGPPADHVVHVYEYGKFKRTIPRKFTDEEAVSFAEEYTRTGKAYGRYAVATPDDEEPAAHVRRRRAKRLTIEAGGMPIRRDRHGRPAPSPA